MEEKAKVIKVGGDDVDLGMLPALTLGHKRRLFRDHGVDLGRMGSTENGFTPEDDFQFVWYLLKQLRPQTTEAEAEAVSLRDVLDITLGAVRSTARAADIPIPGSSPTSLGGAAGDPEKSSS